MQSALLNNRQINIRSNLYNKETLKKWAEKDILLCPTCGQPYEYCEGQIKQPYFRHKYKNSCSDPYHEQETAEHEQGKLDLYTWLHSISGVNNLILEGWIQETKQRPDIMFTWNNQMHVIEYQCSPIASEYFVRHNLYQAAGIRDIWICGAQNYLEIYNKSQSGYKRLNVLETITQKYYDPKLQLLMYVDPNLRYAYRQDNILLSDASNYDKSVNNIMQIKNTAVDYHIESRRGRKGQWESVSTYLYNRSKAYCRKLQDLNWKNGSETNKCQIMD